MRFDDRATDREPQPHSGDHRLGVATRELVENRTLLTRRQSWTTILHDDFDHVATTMRRDANRRVGGRVLGRVLDQVEQHAFDQDAVAEDERQFCGQADLDIARRKRWLEHGERAAHKLFE